MGLESATYIDGLVATNPVGSDDRSTADDHIRLIKAVLKSTFPNADGAYSITDTEANLLVGLSATSTELNKLDGFTGVTADLELLAGVAAGAELTLGILGVDNITINGNSISSVGDLNLQPDAGNQIVLDGTIQVDAGVVTGATSITSTAFVGDITGDVTGNADTVTTNANLTGEVTSVGNAASLGSFTSAALRTALTDETGTGAAVFATSPTLVTPALGTPSALVGTNITGTAAGLSIGGNAASVTTNANLTGDVTSSGNATTLTVAAITGQTEGTTITGTDELIYSDGGVIKRIDVNRLIVGQATALTSGLAATDELLISDAGTIKRMDVSVLSNYSHTQLSLTGAVTSSGEATSLGSFTTAQLLAAVTGETGTGAVVFGTSPTLVTPALGTPSALVGTNITGTATNYTATTCTTIPSLSGDVSSSGNAITIGTGVIDTANIAADAVGTAEIANSLATSSGVGGSFYVTMNSWALFPMIHVNQPAQISNQLTPHITDGGSGSAPRFGITNLESDSWDIDHRYIIAA